MSKTRNGRRPKGPHEQGVASARASGGGGGDFWPRELEAAILDRIADARVRAAWEAGKRLAAAIRGLTIPAKAARAHFAATLRSLVRGVAATALDDVPRLGDAEISDGLAQASSLDELTSTFERLAYKGLYCALVVETKQRNGAKYRAIAQNKGHDAKAVEGVLQTAATVLLEEAADPDPSKDLEREFRRIIGNEGRKIARRGWTRRSISLDGPDAPMDALRLQPTQEPTLIAGKSFAILPTDEHRRVLRLWMDGFSNQKIAEQLGISRRTVERRKHDIRDLLGGELRPCGGSCPRQP